MRDISSYVCEIVNALPVMLVLRNERRHEEILLKNIKYRHVGYCVQVVANMSES